MKSNALNFEILGVPIVDHAIFRAKSIAEKRANASKILALLKEVGLVDSQVALLLLLNAEVSVGWSILPDAPLLL